VLYLFRKHGWEVKGLELAQELADHVKNTLNIEVEVSDFLKFEKDTGQYDLVSLRQVLEHLPDSVLAMKKIGGMLKKDGYAYFEFPNINGFSHRLQRARNKIGFLRKKYDPSFAPGHCNEFSKASFEYLLKMTGFRLIRWETYSKKPLTDFIYNNFHFGTKARAVVQKIN
jgi:SAM-dependent methyltransferase